MKTQVLVIDDEFVSRSMVCTTLQRSGFEVLQASEGQEGMSILQGGACQLAIIDWEMPGMNGLELCRALRSGVIDRYIYLLMLTHHNQPGEVVEGLEAGADDFVTKPFDPMEIVVRLRAGQRLLELSSAEMTIFAMAKLTESRDPETGAHLERVQSYCRLLAESLRRDATLSGQIDDEFVRLIYQTSPLHDIGKVAIPDSVLLKPGRLTEGEFEIMKSHAKHGAATLEAAMRRYPNARFLRMARDIALTHHERYDGEGYPAGLRGDHIPLAGRIMAVADVYDALTSRRVYKEAVAHCIACDMIVMERGSHFDPRVVDALVAEKDEFIRIQQAHSEHPVAAGT